MLFRLLLVFQLLWLYVCTVHIHVHVHVAIRMYSTYTYTCTCIFHNSNQNGMSKPGYKILLQICCSGIPREAKLISFLLHNWRSISVGPCYQKKFLLISNSLSLRLFRLSKYHLAVWSEFKNKTAF